MFIVIQEDYSSVLKVIVSQLTTHQGYCWGTHDFMCDLRDITVFKYENRCNIHNGIEIAITSSQSWIMNRQNLLIKRVLYAKEATYS